jgi:hypothetical protein
MYGKSYLLVFILWFISTVCYSQSYTYSFTDPCTGIVKTVSVPNNGIPITLYGQTRTFTPSDFSSGNVELWLKSVVNSFGGSNPCATLVGTPNAINIAQNTTLQFITIVNNLSTISELSGSVDLLSSSINSTGNSDSKKERKDKKNSSNSNTNTTNNSTENSNSVNTTQTNTTGNNSSNSSSSNNNTTSNNNKTSTKDNGDNGGNNGGNTGTTTSTDDKSKSSESTKQNKDNPSNATPNSTTNTEKSSGGSVNIVGNSVNSIQNVSSESKNGNRPTILASSDLVGFNFKNTDVSYGGKFSGSYTSTRWDGLRSHGIIGDFTTAIKGPNIAGFYAFLHKKRIDLISTSITIGFDNKLSIYGTFAAGQMWKFKKPKNLKLVYLVTTSYGKVYDEKFIGTAFIAGGMYDWKVSKRIDVKLLGLYVYAPYVKYYNDVLLKSPNVVLPIVGTNIGITKRFKINVNMGGAYAININTLNYTIMMGTRLLL